MIKFRTIGAAPAVIAGVMTMTGIAMAETPAAFYAGKTVTFIVGAPPGGTYGLYGQVLAHHIGAHIPGKPTVVVKFHGASSGGMLAANYMQNAATKDGTTIGMTQQTIPINQIMRPESVKYDVRLWQWVGGMAPVRNMLGVWHTAPAQTIEQAKKVEVIVGATGKSSPTYITPTLLNEFVGTKFKVVRGYKGVAGLNLAMERGEIFGRGASWMSIKLDKAEWVRDKKFKVLAIDAATKQPDLPDVPRLLDLVQDPRKRKILELVGVSAEFGRAVFMPPGTPADRVAAMRTAFNETLKDPALLAEAKERKMEIEPQTAAELEEMVKRIFDAPADVIEAARKAMGGE